LARYALPLRGSSRIGLQFIASFLSVWAQHRRQPFDVIHCHSASYPGRRAVFASRKLGIPLIFTPHGEDIQRVPEIGYGLRLDKRWDRTIIRNLQAADAITAISDSVRQELTQFDQQKIFTVPKGIHTRFYGKKSSTYLHDLLTSM
jgi:hypothetical protein